MSNKLKTHFTEEMIKKSKKALTSENDFKTDLTSYFEKPEIANLSPDERAKHIMFVFQDSDFIRPEILLENDNELQKIAFRDEADLNAFKPVLSQYQDDEQILLLNRKNGVKISENLLDEKQLMPFKNPSFSSDLGTDENTNAINQSNKFLNKAYDNHQKIGDATQYELYSNADAFLKSIELDDEESVATPEYEALEYNKGLDFIPLNEAQGFAVGQSKMFDFRQDLSDLSKYDPKNIDELVKDGSENIMARKERQEKDFQKILSGYDVINDKKNDHYSIEGKRVFNVEKGLTGKPQRVYGGMSPSKDTIVAMFGAAPTKDVLQFPYSDENLAEWKAALLEIQEKDLFNLEEIKIAKGVDPAFQKALDEVMGNQFTLGNGLDNKGEKQENTAKNTEKQENVEVADEQKNEQDQGRKATDDVEEEQEQSQTNKQENVEAVDEQKNEQEQGQKATDDVEQEDIDEEAPDESLIVGEDEIDEDKLEDDRKIDGVFNLPDEELEGMFDNDYLEDDFDEDKLEGNDNAPAFEQAEGDEIEGLKAQNDEVNINDIDLENHDFENNKPLAPDNKPEAKPELDNSRENLLNEIKNETDVQPEDNSSEAKSKNTNKKKGKNKKSLKNRSNP